MEKLMTVKEVSELLNLKPSTIRKWVHTGFIPHVKLGKRSVRFQASIIEEWVKTSLRPGRSGRKMSVNL